MRVVEDAESRLSEAIETASTILLNRYNVDRKEMSENTKWKPATRKQKPDLK